MTGDGGDADAPGNRVISVVDRFLEHSRIYYFSDSKALYLSSADWMPRNFFSRLEIAYPVLDKMVYEYLEQVVIAAYLHDTVKARELTPRQREVIQLLAEGRSMKEIAAVLTISLRTVAAHKYRVMEMLAITTNAELYHYAVKHRIVSV